YTILLFTMEHHRKLPEDGCLKPITSSFTNIPCNIMIIKVPDEWKKPGEMTYQLATYDRSIEGMEWPADRYVDKVFPNLPKVKTPKATRKKLVHLDKQAAADYVNKYRKESLATWSEYLKKSYADIDSLVRMNSEFAKPIPNLSKVKTLKESISEVKRVSDTDFIKKRNRKCYKETDVNLSKYQKRKTELSADIDPWIQKPWENPCFNFTVNPVISMNASPLTTNLPFNNMDKQSPAFNYYGHETIYMPTNNTIYKNNYNENLRSEEMSGYSYIYNCVGNQRNGLLTSRMPDSCQPFLPSCHNDLFRNDPPKHKGLLGDYPNDPTSSLNKNFVRYPSENLSLEFNHERKMFPRKNQNSFGKSDLHNNFNRNHAFEFRNNIYESGNHDGIYDHDISNKPYNNQKGNEVYDKFQEHTKITSGIMHMRINDYQYRACNDNQYGTNFNQQETIDYLYENSIDEHSTVGTHTPASFKNKRVRRRKNISSNICKFTADKNISQQSGSSLASFKNSITSGDNSLASNSHLNESKNYCEENKKLQRQAKSRRRREKQRRRRHGLNVIPEEKES
ncbi:uncharacterized protein NPIL_323331, partial [Nephila pilipes]